MCDCSRTPTLVSLLTLSCRTTPGVLPYIIDLDPPKNGNLFFLIFLANFLQNNYTEISICVCFLPPQDAKLYRKLSYRQVTVDNLKVMDETAVALCKENNIPVIVFSISQRGNIVKAAMGDPVGTVVSCEQPVDGV